MRTIASITSQRNGLIADATELLNLELTAERKEQHKKLLEEIDILQRDIDLMNRIERALPVKTQETSPAPTPTLEQADQGQKDSPEQRRAKLNSAWRGYLQRSLEQRDITISAEGGGLIPQELSNFISIALKQYAPLTRYANVRYSINGRQVKASRVVDTSKGLYLFTEGSTSLAGTEQDPVFSSDVITGDLFSTGRIAYSWNLVRDSGFDLEQLLSGLTDTRIGRGIESILTGAIDSAGAATPGNPGLINIANVSVTTASLAANVTFPNIADLYESLDSAYLPRAIWQMNSSTRLSFLKSLDSTNRSLFVPAPNSDGLDMLLGRPIVINSSLPNLGTANAIPILFGSLYDGLEVTISDPRVQAFTESPGLVENQKSALSVWLRVGSVSLAAGSIQALKLAAS
jgi:HK97 family phage major capsid protein